MKSMKKYPRLKDTEYEKTIKDIKLYEKIKIVFQEQRVLDKMYL